MRRTLKLPVAVSVVALAASLPAGATAAVVEDAYVPIAGPRLAGEQVVYADAMPTDVGVGVELRAAPAAGGTPRAVQQFHPYGIGRVRVHPWLAASPTRVGLSLATLSDTRNEEGITSATQFFAGRPGEPLEALSESCSSLYERDIDVSGDVVAHHGPGECREGEKITATLTDFGGAAPASVSLPPGVARLHVAGRYALYAELGPQDVQYVVWDRLTQAAVHRIATPGWSAADLREDGAVAFTANDGAVRGVAIAEPRGELRRLPLPRAGYYGARFAGDGVLVMRGRRLWDGADPTATLDLRDLRGELVRVVARGLDGELDAERFDTDGDRVTFVTRTCDGVRIHVRSLFEPPLRAGALRCRASLLEGPRLSPSGRAIVFRSSCRGFVRLCGGRDASASVRINGRYRAITARGSGASGSDSDPFAVRLNHLGRRLVARRDRLRIRLRLRVGEALYLRGRSSSADHGQIRSGQYVLDTAGRGR